MSKVLSIILGGGKGTRLYPLTMHRSKPAVPFGGKHRIIDIPLSNCINSGFRNIYIVTQFNSASLHIHIAKAYTFDTFSNGFVEILAAEQTFDNTGWYEGRLHKKKPSSFSASKSIPLFNPCRRSTLPHGFKKVFTFSQRIGIRYYRSLYSGHTRGCIRFRYYEG